MPPASAQGRFYTCQVCRGQWRADTGLVANHAAAGAPCPGSRQLPLEVEDGRSTATWADHYGPDFRDYLLGKAKKTRPTNPHKAKATRADMIAAFVPDKAVQGVYAALRADRWTSLVMVALDAEIGLDEAREALCRLRDIGLVFGRAAGWRLVEEVPDDLGELIKAIAAKARRREAAARAAATRARHEEERHQQAQAAAKARRQPVAIPAAKLARLAKLEATANHPNTNPHEAAAARRLADRLREGLTT